MPLEEFNEKYRGGITYWKFDRKEGRINPAESFSVELPPYSQDLSDAGKGPSDGWSFTNSFCSERYVGGIEKGRPPYEAGCSAKDTDYMHVINWKKAAELVKLKARRRRSTAITCDDGNGDQGRHRFLMPEPKSPHGVTSHPTASSSRSRQARHPRVGVLIRKDSLAIKAGKFETKDPYGIPVISMKDTLHKQVSAGSGAFAHAVRQQACIAYTSLYVDSQVAKWDYCEGKVLDKISVHYNIGHLMTMEGDTSKPKGKYLVALNKLAIDRFNPVGPLHPQNHQLIDISGDKMQLLYDMPIPLGEPHYVVAIEAKQAQAGRALQGGHRQPHRRAAPGCRPGR
jgi:nitrous-oxide reductase